MKKLIPTFVLLLAVGFAVSTLRTPKNPAAFDVNGFSRLPILVNGRIKPLDTVARASLLQLQGRQTITTPDQRALLPIEWLLDVGFKPELADTYQTFEIVHPDLLALFSLSMADGQGKKRFAYNQLSKSFGELDRQAKLAGQTDGAVRTPFQRAVMQLYGNLVHYQRLRHAFVSPARPDFLGDLMKLQENVGIWRAAVTARLNKQPHDEAAAAAAIAVSEPIVDMANVNNLFLVIPPEPGDADLTAWQASGPALLQTFQTGRVNPAALAYAGFGHAWRGDKPEQFNTLVGLFRADFEKRFATQLSKGQVEARFNAAQPFYRASYIFGLAFMLGVFSWLGFTEPLRRSASGLVMLGWLLMTGGILTRMWLEGRPPVTNLYSTAPFIGWGAITLCIILEWVYKNSIGAVAGAVIGVATLIIAHHLSLTGDTLEMMRAVLDSNFWLATHVVVINIGYSATFLAGFLALIYICRGMFTTSLDKATADAISRMVYGIICFATLFSFVGTILGGIWADQSWGRFWGWDPKENGALMIVIWCAIILHARWGGMIKQRGLMCLAIGGNIITAWSWFGTNMLGVGLHSYGFTDAAFVALTSFGLSQLLIIGVANLPLSLWRSFRKNSDRPSRPEHTEEFAPAPSR